MSLDLAKGPNFQRMTKGTLGTRLDFLLEFLEPLKSVSEMHVFSKKLWIYFSADRKRAEFFKKAEAGCEDWSTDENRELLRFVSFYSAIAFQNC